MIDFTINQYIVFLHAFLNQGYSFHPFGEFIEKPNIKMIILRHDVDRLPANSLIFAQIENELGIKGTYFFRKVLDSFDEKKIKEIYSMGHEIGYHYEDVNLAAGDRRLKERDGPWKNDSRFMEEEIMKIAIESFEEKLTKLRELVPVKTICMHGSPISRWDSRVLWRYYNYAEFGIIAEPYFDISFDKTLYLTDTGRRWDSGPYSIRDNAQGSGFRAQKQNPFGDWKRKPQPGSLMNMTPDSNDFQKNYKFKSTSAIIHAAEEGRLPDKIMMTFHPQRWTDDPGQWVKELVWQNVKNAVKYYLVKVRK